jgi:MoaA/NifB/PqqE/SkfB family radical SAM enzyme
VPLGGAIELTRRCNQRCRQFYNNLPAVDERARAAEMDTGEVMGLLEEIAAAGCVWLLFTGGEIFLRPDLLEIYDHARRQGLLVTLFTNGTLITPAAAAHLSRSRPFAIEVRLYGATPESCERVTGVPGSFECCRQGIGLLRKHGLPLKLKSTVSSLNWNELPQMRQMTSELGLEFQFDAVLNPRCDGRPGALDVRLSPEEVVSLDLAEPERFSALREFAEQMGREAVPAAAATMLYRCGGVSSPSASTLTAACAPACCRPRRVSTCGREVLRRAGRCSWPACGDRRPTVPPSAPSAACGLSAACARPTRGWSAGTRSSRSTSSAVSPTCATTPWACPPTPMATAITAPAGRNTGRWSAKRRR